MKMSTKNARIIDCIYKSVFTLLIGLFLVSPALASPKESPGAANYGYQWHTFYGSTFSHVNGYGIAIDGSGNIYLACESHGTDWQGDGNTDPLKHYVSGADIVVIKLDRNGHYLWHTFYGSTSSEGAYAIAVDSGNNVYVAGYSMASWLGDGGIAPIHAFSGPRDIVVLKLNSAGAYQWHTFYGSNDPDEGYSIAVEDNSVYVSGISARSWPGDGEAAPIHAHSAGYNPDLVVLKLDNDGAYQWHTFYGLSDQQDAGLGIAAGESNDVYITGESWASWQGDLDTDPKHAFGGYKDLFVLKLNGAGAYQWHTFYGSGDWDGGYGIATKSGKVYVTGISYATWQGDSNTGPLHGYSGNIDLLALKLLDSGAYQWHTFWGGGGYDNGRGIALSADEDIYIAGDSTSSWSGGANQNPLHPFSGVADLLAMKLDANGWYQWHTFYGSNSQYDTGKSVAVGAQGDAFVAGYGMAGWQGDGGFCPIHSFSGDEDALAVNIGVTYKNYLPLLLH